MKPSQVTTYFLEARTLLAVTFAACAILLVAPAMAEAKTVADAARQLAKDASVLTDSKQELESVRAELKKTRAAKIQLRDRIEVRLVTIYKYGGSLGSVTEAALSGKMSDLGESIDALDILAEQEREAIEKWQGLIEKLAELEQSEKKLTKKVSKFEKAVKEARAELMDAKARAAEARAEAARLAQIRKSPILPRIGAPEQTMVAAAEGTAAPASNAALGYSQSGVASYYDDSFNGQTTANGETYSSGAFTAAHPTLPFGTWVTVSGPSGSVAVRINDRGPFVGGRIIDLSRAAAESIGVDGVANVNISVQA